MRLVDADALIDAMTGACNIFDAHGVDTTISRTLITIAGQAPTIEAEPVRWINMDEDEPLLGQKVLVYRAQKPIEIMSMLYLDNEYLWRNNVDEIFKVYDNDYWMPLPEPPKEVSG